MARKPILKKNLGKKIRRLRKEKGLKQRELAEMADISEKYISNIENGGTSCSLAVLISLANCLNTSMDYLLSDLLKNNKLESNIEPINKLLIEIDNLSEQKILYLVETAKLLKNFEII